MKKTFFVLIAIIVLAAASSAFTKMDAGPGYKNLKILPANITEKEMDSVMHHFTNSLGVKCNFCHVRNEEKNEWDYASDDKKHKLVAREMMTMTNKINDQYFPYGGKAEDMATKLTVTCYTCHHGNKEPQVRPSNEGQRFNNGRGLSDSSSRFYPGNYLPQKQWP